MAPITFASLTSTINSTSASTISISYPSGIAAGDALVLCLINTNPTTQTTPTGWSAAVQSNTSVNGNLACYVFEKTAAGTESGSISSTLGAASSGIAAMLRYTSVNATGPFGTSVSTNSGATNTTTSPASGTLSPVPALTDLVVRFYTFAQNTAATGQTMTNPGGTWVTRGNLVTAGGSGVFQNGLVVADKPNGTDNQTVTSNNTGSWMVVDLNIHVTLSTPQSNSLNVAAKRASFY